MVDFFRYRIELFIFLFIALGLQCAVIFQVPFLSQINYPLNIVQTYFHELTHGLGALITGGHFYRMQLDFGQGGLAHTLAGNTTVTVFGGYFGPTLWGALIYIAFTRWFRDRIDFIPLFFFGLVALTLLLLVRNFTTAGIVIFIGFLFYSIARMESLRQMDIAMRFLCIYLIVAGGLEPYKFYYHMELFPSQIWNSWDGRVLADGGTHPERYWVRLWVGAALAAFLVIFALEGSQKRNDVWE
jgi:hypothetical protein